MNRRHFLRIAGSAAVITAAAPIGCSSFRSRPAATAPWDQAGSPDFGDPRVRALSHAILAPNPHNRQAWLVDLRTPGEALLLCELDRRLPDTDPFDRQTVIGLGCFLEILRMAAAEEGRRAEVTRFPEGQDAARLDARPIARIRFVVDDTVDRDPLFAFVQRRRSNKNAYDTSRVISDEACLALCETAGPGLLAQATNDPERLAELRELSWEALRLELTTSHLMKESIDLMRIGKREISENPDGLAFGGSMFETLRFLGLFTREAMADPDSIAFKQGLAMSEKQLRTAMSYVWVATPGNTREDQLAAGRAWVRINLRATELGLGLQPLSQALQEYPEMTAYRDQIHRTLDVGAPATLQMFGRIGYGPEAIATPRWPATTRIIGPA